MALSFSSSLFFLLYPLSTSIYDLLPRSSSSTAVRASPAATPSLPLRPRPAARASALAVMPTPQPFGHALPVSCLCPYRKQQIYNTNACWGPWCEMELGEASLFSFIYPPSLRRAHFQGFFGWRCFILPCLAQNSSKVIIYSVIPNLDPCLCVMSDTNHTPLSAHTSASYLVPIRRPDPRVFVRQEVPGELASASNH